MGFLKNKYVLGALLLQATMLGNNLYADVYRQNINEGWKFRQARLHNWYNATVPGVVHTDLIDNAIIEDPFSDLTKGLYNGLIRKTGYMKQQLLARIRFWKVQTSFLFSRDLILMQMYILMIH